MSSTERIRVPDDYYDQTPDGDALATEATMNVIRTADLMYDGIGRLLRPLGVSGAGGLVLGILRDHGSMSPSQLGTRLIVTRATVTGLLDSLERRGLVRRSARPGDRRSVLVEITPQGRDVLQAIRTVVHREERAWMAAIPPAELRRLIRSLHRIQDALARHAAPDEGPGRGPRVGRSGPAR